MELSQLETFLAVAEEKSFSRAAVRLRVSDEPISAIAYAAGFNDLSTFNRRFRRVMGVNPGTYRRRSS